MSLASEIAWEMEANGDGPPFVAIYPRCDLAANIGHCGEGPTLWTDGYVYFIVAGSDLYGPEVDSRPRHPETLVSTGKGWARADIEAALLEWDQT